MVESPTNKWYKLSTHKSVHIQLCPGQVYTADCQTTQKQHWCLLINSGILLCTVYDLRISIFLCLLSKLLQFSCTSNQLTIVQMWRLRADSCCSHFVQIQLFIVRSVYIGLILSHVATLIIEYKSTTKFRAEDRPPFFYLSNSFMPLIQLYNNFSWTRHLPNTPHHRCLVELLHIHDLKQCCDKYKAMTYSVLNSEASLTETWVKVTFS